MGEEIYINGKQVKGTQQRTIKRERFYIYRPIMRLQSRAVSVTSLGSN